MDGHKHPHVATNLNMNAEARPIAKVGNKYIIKV